MQQGEPTNWKGLVLNLVSVLRWPVVFVIVFLLLRPQFGILITAMGKRLQNGTSSGAAPTTDRGLSLTGSHAERSNKQH